jgi:hypothetical protein
MIARGGGGGGVKESNNTTAKRMDYFLFEKKKGNPGQRPNPNKTWCMGPFAGVDYYRTLCPFQSRLQHIYLGHGQPYARVDPKPTESVATLPPFSPIEGQKWFDQISNQ